MCLDTVDKRTNKGTGEGYKVFRRDKYYHMKPNIVGTTKYQYNKWYEAKDNVQNFDKLDYPVGFHVFPKLKDAQNWLVGEHPLHRSCIRKVLYFDVVASGRQTGMVGKNLSVIVARKMLICKDKV